MNKNPDRYSQSLCFLPMPGIKRIRGTTQEIELLLQGLPKLVFGLLRFHEPEVLCAYGRWPDA
jgi:hypothetical protein